MNPVTERILPQVQAAEMAFWNKNSRATLYDKVRSYVILNVLNIEPRLRIKIPSCHGSAT